MARLIESAPAGKVVTSQVTNGWLRTFRQRIGDPHPIQIHRFLPGHQPPLSRMRIPLFPRIAPGCGPCHDDRSFRLAPALRPSKLDSLCFTD